MADGTLVVIETSGGNVRDICLELLGAAAELPGEVAAVVIGHGVQDVAGDVAARGADRVLVADAPAFERYSTDGYVAAIDAAVAQASPRLVLLAGTTSGRDLGPHLAAREGHDCLSDCIAIGWDGDRLSGTRPVFQGKMLTDVQIDTGSPAYAVIRGGAFSVPDAADGSAEVESLDVSFDPEQSAVQFLGVSQAKGGDTNLEGADIVVVGGRGVGSAENFQLILDLAEAIGGAVGATRAVTDLGWRPHHEQIGQTGANVRPKLYIGVGVSGAVQHAVGMQGSETIVAINRDADAPLFRMAEIGVVGDLHEIVPHLIDELRAARSGSS